MRRLMWMAAVVLGGVAIWLAAGPEPMSDVQRRLLQGGRSRLGDSYDADFYPAGYPPAGRSACTDIIYFACRPLGIDLQEAVARDMALAPAAYPSHRHKAINHRWCPDLMVWFARTQETLPKNADFEPGDVVFWSYHEDRVPDHVGMVTSRHGPRILHQGGVCREEAMPTSWPVVGHFRLWRVENSWRQDRS